MNAEPFQRGSAFFAFPFRCSGRPIGTFADQSSGTTVGRPPKGPRRSFGDLPPSHLDNGQLAYIAAHERLGAGARADERLGAHLRPSDPGTYRHTRTRDNGP